MDFKEDPNLKRKHIPAEIDLLVGENKEK